MVLYRFDSTINKYTSRVELKYTQYIPEHPDSAFEDGKHLRFDRDLNDVPPLARFQKSGHNMAR